MKKILLVLVVLVFATPAMADVIITAAQVGEPCDVRVEISYDATSELTSRVRAFGLDITLNNDANIVDVIPAMVGACTESEKGYGIFPGTIQIAADGTVTDYGTMAAEYGDLPGDTLPGPPDGNGVTLEAASLYAPVGSDGNAPPKSGVLCWITVDANTCLSISANVSRAGPTGVVMENPDEVVTVDYPAECIYVERTVPQEECMKTSHPDYPDWEAVGKPLCWCYARQCRGDIDGIKYGPFWVGVTDLDLFKTAFNKATLPAGGICADLDHTQYGPFRVGVTDLDILKLYFNKGETMVSECPDEHINYWETP